MSLGATGKLGDSVVFMTWKGLNTVRKYVVPANPKTYGQLDQRALVTAAVTEFHGALYNALDKGAFNTLAGIGKKTMSGFNRFVKEHVDEAILGNTWKRINHGGSYAVTTTSFKVGCSKAAAGNVPRIRWGTSKTALLTSANFVNIGGNDWEYNIVGLTANTLYYFSMDVGTSGTDWGRLGIYSQRTAAV